ncbi:MAG: 16S rRNA processing protein RimM [Paracoccaceae bacterium]|jgi:16S rRNA processing protein RimM
MSETRVCIAAIGGSYGVRGDVRLKSFCAQPENVASYGPLSSEDGTRQFEIVLQRAVKNGFSARLSGIATKEEADALKGARLYAERSVLPDLPDDEYYHADLIGLEVRDTGGTLIGTVRAVHDHGAGDLIEIGGPSLKATVLLPFTLAIVPTVDLGAGRIVIDPPEGMLLDDDTTAPEADD